nr:MAG TPA: hypothetical protein [Caudoviricetes sp.]
MKLFLVDAVKIVIAKKNQTLRGKKKLKKRILNQIHIETLECTKIAFYLIL